MLRTKNKLAMKQRENIENQNEENKNVPSAAVPLNRKMEMSPMEYYARQQAQMRVAVTGYREYYATD